MVAREGGRWPGGEAAPEATEAEQVKKGYVGDNEGFRGSGRTSGICQGANNVPYCKYKFYC